MTAIEVARSAGLGVRQKGSRWWMLCPFHNERTSSFCIFPDGHWYCFGCGEHGDAVSLYAALHHVAIGDALRAVKGNAYRPKPRVPTANDLRSIVEDWRDNHWHMACRQIHSAQAELDALNGKDCEKLWQALERKAHSEDELNALEASPPKQLVSWMLAERSNS